MVVPRALAIFRDGLGLEIEFLSTPHTKGFHETIAIDTALIDLDELLGHKLLDPE